MKAKNLFLLMTLLVVTVSSQAQVSVNVNVGTPPVWAPAAPVAATYYYLPDLETYYDVPAQRYIYMRNGTWHRSAARALRRISGLLRLPSRRDAASASAASAPWNTGITNRGSTAFITRSTSCARASSSTAR